MGSKDESHPSILYDPSPSSSSATQPLLSSVAGEPFPALPSSAVVSSAASSSDDSYAPISYLHGRRPLRDLPFLLLFLLLSLATFVFGFVALARRNPSAAHVDSFVYDRSSSACVLPSSFSDRLSTSKPFLKDLIWTLVPTLLLAGPAAVAGLLFLLRRCARQLIYFAVPFFVIIPAGLNIYWFVACALSASCRSAFPLAYRILVLAFIFLLIAIIAWIIVANWHRVELTVRIVRVAAAALEANAALLFVLPALGIGLLVYFAPIVVFVVFSTWNGRVEPKVEKTDREYYECVWRQDRWVPSYFALAIVTMIWSAAAMVEAKVFVISGTVAQWYFSKEGSKPSKSLRSSLRNAFGPSFGTVCFSGMVMGAVRFVRAIVDSAKENEAATGFINIIIRCCANFLLAAFDFVNKFTINFAAITGEGYCSASKMTYELLKRNLLSAVFVETVSTRVLAGTVFVVSTLYAIAICAILKAVSALESEMYLVAASAWLLLMVILGYFVHVLDNVIDTVYVCYAIDRDKGEVCKQEVHEVYVHLPISRNHRSAINRTLV